MPEEITGRLTAGSVDFPQPRNKKSGNRKDETSRDHGARIDARCGDMDLIDITTSEHPHNHHGQYGHKNRWPRQSACAERDITRRCRD